MLCRFIEHAEDDFFAARNRSVGLPVQIPFYNISWWIRGFAPRLAGAITPGSRTAYSKAVRLCRPRLFCRSAQLPTRSNPLCLLCANKKKTAKCCLFLFGGDNGKPTTLTFRMSITIYKPLCMTELYPTSEFYHTFTVS